MATPALDEVQFPLAYCRTCDRDVLAYLDEVEDVEVRRCLQCDGRLSEWRDATVHEIEEAGYSLLEARSCGNGGGCSAGGCATRR